MRIVALLGAGVALGALLTAMSRYRRSEGSRWAPYALLVARLLLLVAVVGWSARAFGPASAFAVLAGVITTRALMMRAGTTRLPVERDRDPGPHREPR